MDNEEQLKNKLREGTFFTLVRILAIVGVGIFYFRDVLILVIVYECIYTTTRNKVIRYRHYHGRLPRD